MLEVKSGTQPKFLQPRKLPFSLRVKVEAELKQLHGITVLVEYSD